MHLNSKMHLLQMIKELQAAAVNDFLGLVRCMLGRKIDIQSKCKIFIKSYRSLIVSRLTSDKDRTGGFTQSSQHFDKSVSNTNGGGTPSHLVRSCNWRRFS